MSCRIVRNQFNLAALSYKSILFALFSLQYYNKYVFYEQIKMMMMMMMITVQFILPWKLVLSLFTHVL